MHEITDTYDGSGNQVSTKGADGKATIYRYDFLDLVSSINYNEAKNVSYLYNRTGDLVYMKDWLGETTLRKDRMDCRCIKEPF